MYLIDVQVKEVIISFYILMEMGKATLEVHTVQFLIFSFTNYINVPWLLMLQKILDPTPDDVSLGSWPALWRTNTRRVWRKLQFWCRWCSHKAREVGHCFSGKIVQPVSIFWYSHFHQVNELGWLVMSMCLFHIWEQSCGH